MSSNSTTADFGNNERMLVDDAAWAQRVTVEGKRLKRMVSLRLDPRLQGRLDASDVLQEVMLEATRRRIEYERQADSMPLFLWLRYLAMQRLQIVHRQHLGTQARDARRELSIDQAPLPEATSAALAAQLLGRDTRASDAFHRAERRLRLQRALEQLDPIDREVLALRHFEQLTNGECARVLGIQESAATKRYIRALRRLKGLLAELPGGLSELLP